MDVSVILSVGCFSTDRQSDPAGDQGPADRSAHHPAAAAEVASNHAAVPADSKTASSCPSSAGRSSPAGCPGSAGRSGSAGCTDNTTDYHLSPASHHHRHGDRYAAHHTGSNPSGANSHQGVAAIVDRHHRVAAGAEHSPGYCNCHPNQ